MTTSYYFWGHQRVGLLRGRKKWSIDACPYSCCIFSLCFTTFFLSLLSFFTLSFLLLSCHVLFPICGLSFSWVLLSGCLLLSYHGFSSLKCFPPLGISLSMLFSLPLFFSLPFGLPFFCLVTFLL